MKNLAIVMLIITLQGCSTAQKENAQTEQENYEIENTENQETESMEMDMEIETETIVEEEAQNHYIKINSPSDRSVYDPSYAPIVFTGTVSEGATKIVVTADFTKVDIENRTSSKQQDVYELTTFEANDTTFTYRAKSSWNNLGLGTNTYVFTAYFEDGNTTSTTMEICYQMEVFYPPSCW